MRRLWGFFTVALLAASPPARAQGPAPAPAADPAEDAGKAVRLAKAAFEYRDFQKVVDTLDPWLHPPRIVDDALEVQARMLLGVSLHVLGQPAKAADEFALLLKLAPDHELDPFVVPPRVIQTFEEVRAKMKPALDARRKERDARDGADPDPPPPAERVVVRVESPPSLAYAIAPLGVPQFAADEPGWGVFWASLQVVGLAINVTAYTLGERVSSDPDDPNSGRLTLWTTVMYGGAALAAGGWIGSSVQGYGQLQAKAEAARARSAPAPAPSGPAPARSRLAPAPTSLGWSWRF